MKHITRFNPLILVALLALGMVLAACGDATNTAAPAATTAAATTAAMTTAAMTTAAATTAPAATTAAITTSAATSAAATTAAMTTEAATTAAMTTAAATTAAGATSAADGTPCATCPASYAQLQVPDALVQASKKGLPSTITDYAFEAYVSDDAYDKVATDVDASSTSRGFTFALPGGTKPIKVGSTYSAAYTKTGSPDVVVQIVDAASLPEVLKGTGVDDATLQSFISSVGTKKTVVFIFGGTGLVAATLNATGVATVAAPTVTVQTVAPPTTSSAGQDSTN